MFYFKGANLHYFFGLKTFFYQKISKKNPLPQTILPAGAE